MKQSMQKADVKHQPPRDRSAERQGMSGMAIGASQGDRMTQLSELAESSVQAREQTQLTAMIEASPRMAVQRRMVAQRKDTGAASQREVVSHEKASAIPNRTGLPDTLKSGIESLSGISMDRVKVHYNSGRPAQLNALAYAQGTDIHLAPGQEKHLPHEAWHVVQQAQGRVQPTMQMKDAVPVNNDVGLEREADVMGAKASLVVQGNMPFAASDLPTETAFGVGKTVQRIVRLAGAQVPPPYHDELVARVRAHFESFGVGFLPAHEVALRAWANDRDHVIAAPSIDDLAFNLHRHVYGEIDWVNNVTCTEISVDDMKAAKAMRSRDRLARTMEPTTTSTPSRVPGLGNLDDTELLRLQEHGLEEEQNWIRLSGSDPKKLDTIKRKGISGKDEAHITACGDKDNPSYVVALNNHHLGHRYVGTGRQKGTGNARTYGSKKDREGYEYKGSGLVDGHAIQVQDDQPILGPFQKDAADWSTTIAKTDGSSVTYEDQSYLPKDKHDRRMIEKHPHNFYWENQGQGQRMRQKSIEAPDMKSGASFVHFNQYEGETFHPNAGRASTHTYDLASRVHYLQTDSSGTTKHYSCDNRAVADYSNHKGYNATTHQYPDIPSGVPKKSENKNLGGLSAFDHLKLAEMPNTSTFPFATVLHPEDPDFTFKPDHRTSVTGYESPPSSPYWTPDELEDETRVASGNIERQRHFHDTDGALIVDTSYDKTQKQTTFKVKKRKILEPSQWPVGGNALGQFAAAPPTKKLKLSEEADIPPQAPTSEAPILSDLAESGNAPDSNVSSLLTEAIEDHLENAELSTDMLAELQASFEVHDDVEAAARVLLELFGPLDQAPVASVSLAWLEAIEEHQERIDHLADTLTELQASLGAHANAHGALLVLINTLGNVDRNDPGQADQVGWVYTQAVGWFRANASQLYRGTAEHHAGEAGDDALGESGERLASLRQYFSECAQMAVHNVLSFDAINDDELDENLLDTHGDFGQNLGEGDIRDMLAAAHRPDLPVIGNLGDLQGLLQDLHDFGPGAAEYYHIGDDEQQGHESIRAFAARDVNVLNLIVNTRAATRSRGSHWIAVHLSHQPDGQIAVKYLDSYDAPIDYRELFDGLRTFFGAVPPNAVPPLGAQPDQDGSQSLDGL